MFRGLPHRERDNPDVDQQCQSHTPCSGKTFQFPIPKFSQISPNEMAIANAAVLTAKSNNQIKKPIKPLLKITFVIDYMVLMLDFVAKGLLHRDHHDWRHASAKTSPVPDLALMHHPFEFQLD